MSKRDVQVWLMFLTVACFPLVLAQTGCPLRANHIREQNHCIYRAWNEGDLDGIHMRLEGCDVDSFEALSRRDYARDADTVWYKQWAIPEADAASFEVLPSQSPYWPYARDNRHVFLQRHIVLGADPKTFRALRPPYSDDAQRAYCGTLPLELEGRERIRVLESHVRLMGTALERALSELSYSAANAEKLLDRFGDDAWVVFSVDGRARAGDQIYYGCGLLRGIDLDSFENLSGGYSKDSHAVYWGHAAIPGADPQSFEFLDPACCSNAPDAPDAPDARDANRSYKSGRPR